ncbi:cellulose synthase/poly-beta-1,6-N-acetylglucosamine synthase-like glycosyltransferase [Novosphingobium sp. SG751A]|uniref:glycosyltransferase family 2 protein n=1 Tax=Novosphingobium sp. SG751A TaxID=2587000 RepID=UPI001557C1AC|nr:glycosyltransferase family 2 protein [Novosphingobium sp. SG751A]NOW46449.1 cellulose synthase/poly-beta-1,6-N-acetylglucosamine synthase-like glycosyltransferase [Novosphingobium sp. SG751A]
MLALECLAGVARAPWRPHGAPPPFVALIPAHDEAAGIAAVVAAIAAQLRPCDRMLVVADNCRDDTAALARAGGAQVVERHDATRRGKAYALAFGRAALRADAPSVVIIVDADCRPEPGALARLAAHADQSGAVVQGCYLLTTAPAAAPLVRVSNLAFLIKNLVRQRGLQRLGGGALLQGTGMAFPWAIFAAAPLETASLVEDLQLGLDLRLRGCAVRFDSHACFTSHASAQTATQGQRTRWEHGSILTALHYWPRLMRAGLSGRAGLLVLAADLAIPPLALLAAIAIVCGAVLLVAAVLTGAGLGRSGLGGPVAPLLVLVAAGTGALTVLAGVWLALGRGILPGAMALQLPRYLFWKLPIYRRLARARQSAWVRTSREP